jgi:tetratricopeptide (TPR) repeat protein
MELDMEVSMPRSKRLVWQAPSQLTAMYAMLLLSICQITAKSRGQYMELLKMAVKEFPQDPRMWTYMCREYLFYSEWENVIAAATSKLENEGWDVESAAVCRWAGEAAHQLGQEETARMWYDKGRDILPLQGEPQFGVAMDAYRKQEWQRCLDASINALESPRSNHYCYESAVSDWKAFDLAGIAAYNLKHIDEAITFTKEAVKANGPENDRIQRNLKFFEEVQMLLGGNCRTGCTKKTTNLTLNA